MDWASVTKQLGKTVERNSDSVVPGAREGVPLTAPALDAIDIQRYGNSREAGQNSEDGVGSVAVKGHVDTVKEQVKSGEKGVGQSVEIFVANGGNVAQLDAAIFRQRAFLPAIDSHFMPAFREAHG